MNTTNDTPGAGTRDFNNMKTIAVIDGNSLLHRAFHAVPPTMTAPDGRHTNACFGFLSMLFKLIEEFRPSGIICAFDAGVPAYRFEAIEKYKAQRPPTATELKEQFPIIKELLIALGIPVVSKDGWEGDDILGTVSAYAERQGNIRTLLVTGDKDVLQLVTEKTQVVNTRTGMSDVIIYDPAGVVERFGVGPELIPDFLGLMGDSSDNIPGVPGVGPKKALALLTEYGTMEAVLDHADEVKGKLGENLRANKEQARASRSVATIVCDVELDIDIDAVQFPDFDLEEVKRVFGSYALNSHLRKITKLAGAGTSSSRSDKGVSLTATLPTALPEHSAAELGAARLRQSSLPNAPTDPSASRNRETPLSEHEKSASKQTNTSSLLALAKDIMHRPVLKGAEAHQALNKYLENPQEEALPSLLLHIEELTGSTLFDQATRLLYVATDAQLLCFEEEELGETLLHVVSSARIAAYNIKALLQEIIGRDSSKPARIDALSLDPARLFDLSIASYLLESSKSHKDLREMAARWIPEIAEELSNDQDSDQSREEGGAKPGEEPSGAASLALVAALSVKLKEALIEDESIDCYEKIEAPLIPVLVAMERVGVTVAPLVLEEQSTRFSAVITELRARAHEMAGEEFNLDSPKQLGAVLFEKLKLPTLKKTRTGYSTNAAVLEELKPLHPLPALMIEYRELAKLKSTYLDALPNLIGKDQRVHTSFNQTITATGRLSSSDPNLQNIPVRTELGRQIRTAFISDPAAFDNEEAVFLSADYSQIELRLLAHFSGDEHLINAFQTGVDFHSSTAARVFGVSLDEVTPQMRSRAKAVNFGIVYGQQAFGLSQSLGIPFAEGKEMIERYFAAYPQVQAYLKQTVSDAYERGWATTLFGRKRHIQELHSSNANLRNFGERTAMNHPMQGSAADIIKLAMIEVAHRLRDEGFVSTMVLQVHDELDFNCARSEIERLSSLVKKVMEGVVDLAVPITVEVSYGDNWAEAH